MQALRACRAARGREGGGGEGGEEARWWMYTRTDFMYSGSSSSCSSSFHPWSCRRLGTCTRSGKLSVGCGRGRDEMVLARAGAVP